MNISVSGVFEVPHLARVTLAALLFISLALPGLGQDTHLGQDPAQRLYSTSSFAHGYLHGYEQGYHYGDMDLQLSHGPQNLKAIRAYNAGSRHFQKDFGDKVSFVQGYEAGFRVGYSDALGGSEFRAVLNMRELAHELPEIQEAEAPVLNQAITRGYSDGVKSGLNDGRTTADYRPDGSDCELALRFKEPPSKSFCSIYSLGYRLGYSDGFHNQHPEPVERKVAGER